MKKKALIIFLAIAVLCSSFAAYTVSVSAEGEEIDSRLRAWFDFNEEHILDRGDISSDIFLDVVMTSDAVKGTCGDDVSLVAGLNGTALKFEGTAASNILEMATLACPSAFYIESDANLLEGDNVTINIVYKEDNTEQIQNIFYAGLQPTEFATIKTSASANNAGPEVSVNNSSAMREQKISASADTIPEAGTWNMMTVVQEGTTCKIYLNGTLVQTATMDNQLGDIQSVEGGKNVYALGAPSPYNDLSVFSNSDFMTNPSYFTDPGFKGLIDDFRVYGAALTAEEIEELAVALNVVSLEPVDAYAENMFGLVVDASYDNVGGVAVPDDPGDNTNGIGNVHNNAWVRVSNVAFGEAGATNITLKYCAKESRMGANGKVAIWMDGKSADENGTLIGTVDLPITGTEYSHFDIVTADLTSAVTGTHNVYFVFTADTTEENPYVANMSYFKFGVAGDDSEDGGEEGNVKEELVSSTVIDWDFSDEDSIAGVTLGEGVTVENGKATFAPGNQGIALPDDIFADAKTITIEMTMQPSAFANYRALLCGGNQNGKWFVMGVMEDGSVRYAVATNGEDSSEAKGNSVSGEGGATEGVVGSNIVLTTDKEYAVKYVITQAETKVYVEGKLALTVPTPGKDAIGEIGGPVVLGKATKWPDSSYEGTISNFKVTIEKMEFVEGGNNGSGTGDDATNKPGTGDVAMLSSLLAAGVAALGGLKLRKRAK